MTATDKPLFDRTVADLMSEVVVRLREWTPLREAAEELSRAGVHGAPVVDADGRCVGILSVSDLARWAVRRDGPVPTRPRTCGHQKRYRAAGGVERVLCALPAGTCSCQTPTDLPGGYHVQDCREPNCVALEWQMVELEGLPAEDVRHYMTCEPVTVRPDTSIGEVARRMLDARVRRVVVTDPAGVPVGIVSVSDIVAAVAAGTESSRRLGARPDYSLEPIRSPNDSHPD
jgi:CBS domain-containing protein